MKRVARKLFFFWVIPEAQVLCIYSAYHDSPASWVYPLGQHYDNMNKSKKKCEQQFFTHFLSNAYKLQLNESGAERGEEDF